MSKKNPHEITVITDFPDFYRVQDHGRLPAVHISKHALFRLKITVGCPCTCPSIRVCVVVVSGVVYVLRVCVCGMCVLCFRVVVCCAVSFCVVLVLVLVCNVWCVVSVVCVRGVCCVCVCGAAWHPENPPCEGSKLPRV